MPFKPGQARPSNAGRRPGSPNRKTQAIRDVVLLSAYSLGGWQRLVQWAQASPENEREFWSRIFPRLLPRQGTGEHGEFAINAQILADVMADLQRH